MNLASFSVGGHTLFRSQCTAVKSLVPPCQRGGHSSATGAALGPYAGTFPLRVGRRATSLLLKQGHLEQAVQEQPTDSPAASTCGKTVFCLKGRLLLDCCRTPRRLGVQSFPLPTETEQRRVGQQRASLPCNGFSKTDSDSPKEKSHPQGWGCQHGRVYGS